MDPIELLYTEKMLFLHIHEYDYEFYDPKKRTLDPLRSAKFLGPEI